MRVPEHFRYTSEHQWAWQERALVRIGLTDFAQVKLGAVIFADLPPPGTVLQQGDAYGLVETVKVAVELLAPLSGRVAAVNAQLQDCPGLINEDPYGAGWLCRIEPSRPDQLAGLSTAARYRELHRSAADPVRSFRMAGDVSAADQHLTGAR